MWIMLVVVMMTVDHNKLALVMIRMIISGWLNHEICSTILQISQLLGLHMRSHLESPGSVICIDSTFGISFLGLLPVCGSMAPSGGGCFQCFQIKGLI